MSELYEKSLVKLELNQVLAMLADCAGSEGGKDKDIFFARRAKSLYQTCFAIFPYKSQNWQRCQAMNGMTK